MAYNCLHSNSYSGYIGALEFISESLQTIGWTLHDDISSTDKVFTSTGEDDNFVNAYVRIYVSSYIRFDAYMWWNNSTHVGTGRAYSSTSYNYIRTTDGRSLIVYGDKDEIVVWTAGTSYNYMTKSFGFVQPYITGYTTTTSGISSGSDIIVDVDDSSVLNEGTYAMIIGTETEGRDRVYVKDINSNTQITLSSTPRSYVSGAKIGHYPCTLYCGTSDYGINVNNFCYVCGYQSSSITDGVNSCRYMTDSRLHLDDSYLDPESYLQKYVLQPFGLQDYNSPYTIVGYLKYLKYAPVSNYYASNYNQYLYCCGNKHFSGVPTSTLSSGIIDIGHDWINNEFEDKIVVITSGPGLGQTRKVLSNTNDTLSIGDLWGTDPDSSSTYEIYDSVYRNLHAYFCIKEIVS